MDKDVILSDFCVQLMKLRPREYKKRLSLRSDSVLGAELPDQGSLNSGGISSFFFCSPL